MAYQQRFRMRGDRMVMLDQQGDSVSEQRMVPNMKLPDEFVEIEPVLRLDDCNFIAFAGNRFTDLIIAVQMHWLELAKLGFGETLENLCEAFVRPWEGNFLTDEHLYEVGHGVGVFDGLDGMGFRFVKWSGERIEGALSVTNDPKTFALEAEAGPTFFRDFLLSTSPSIGQTASGAG
jgi:hypothetical protein